MARRWGERGRNKPRRQTGSTQSPWPACPCTDGADSERLFQCPGTGHDSAVVNTDQGSQFTSEEFTRVLLDHGIEISMDGRGRCHDNIFVERLRWTVKQEWIYLRPAANGLEQKRSLAKFFDWETDVAHTRRSGGRHRTRPIAARRARAGQRQRNAMAQRRCEFVDSRLRRYPPDRASAVPYGQAGENALRFPHLAQRSAAVHKLHSTTATSRIEFDSGKGEAFSRRPALAYGLCGFTCWSIRRRRSHDAACLALPSSPCLTGWPPGCGTEKVIKLTPSRTEFARNGTETSLTSFPGSTSACG